MGWDVRLNEVESILGQSIKSFDEIESIAERSGLSLHQVRHSRSTPANFWHGVIARAYDEGDVRVDLLLDLALVACPSRSRDTLGSAIDRYRELRAA